MAEDSEYTPVRIREGDEQTPPESKTPKTVRGRARERSISEGMLRKPKQAQFVAELAVNGGNVLKASEAVGYSESYGRQLVSRNESVREALGWIRDRNLSRAIVWADMMPIAQTELFRLATESENEMVRLHALRLIIAYAEGTPVSRTEALVVHKREAATVTEDVYRWALNQMVSTGKPLAQLLEEAKKNPKAVKEWHKARAPQQLPSSLASTRETVQDPDTPPDSPQPHAEPTQFFNQGTSIEDVQIPDTASE